MTPIEFIDHNKIEQCKETIRRIWNYKKVDHIPISVCFDDFSNYTLREQCENGELQVDVQIGNINRCLRALPDGAPSSLDAVFEVVGTEGRAQIDASTDGLTVYDAAGVTHPRSVYAAEVHGRLTGVLSEEVRHFARCILDGAEPAVTGADGREVVRVARAITESYTTGRAVEL